MENHDEEYGENELKLIFNVRFLVQIKKSDETKSNKKSIFTSFLLHKANNFSWNEIFWIFFFYFQFDFVSLHLKLIRIFFFFFYFLKWNPLFVIFFYYYLIKWNCSDNWIDERKKKKICNLFFASFVYSRIYMKSLKALRFFSSIGSMWIISRKWKYLNIRSKELLSQIYGNESLNLENEQKKN